MRKPLIAGNWKMYKTIKEAIELVTGLKRELSDISAADIVVCPPFTALSDVSDSLIDTNIGLGGQDVHWEKEGAFTGEVSAAMLKEAGCAFVIIGHSERRQYFFETNETVNKKIKAALSAGLTPIVCIGETLKEREAAKTMAVVEKQLQEGLKALSGPEISKLVIAYEPVWAIGTGKNATPQQAQEVHKFIREWFGKSHGPKIAESLRILYGGSVKASNAKELFEQPDVDGGLVGGASLDSASFSVIVKSSI